MDRRERFIDEIEALRVAMDGRLAELWTALPGIVESFDADTLTVSVQPAIQGKTTAKDGSTSYVDLPLLINVPVVFPRGGGFSLTFPIAQGDECLVVFASRCIDAWWQNGDVGQPMETRMHDLSDGFALVGPYSQPNVIDSVDTENVQLRNDDGTAFVEIHPDETIRALNEQASITVGPEGAITSKNSACSVVQSAAGEITAKNDTCSVDLSTAGIVSATADTTISLTAPTLALNVDALTMYAKDGESDVSATIHGDLKQVGDYTQSGSFSTDGDVTASEISLTSHVHSGVETGSGSTGAPE